MTVAAILDRQAERAQVRDESERHVRTELAVWFGPRAADLAIREAYLTGEGVAVNIDGMEVTVVYSRGRYSIAE